MPNFQKPKSKNAATTLLLLGVIASAMLAGIIYLANATKVHIVLDPATEFLLNGKPLPEGYIQNPAISQIAQTIFGAGSIPFYIVVAATGVILVFASNTAFNGFPVLGSILAQDGYLPRQLRTRGDRLAFSNGVLALAAGALVLIIAFNADVTKLIQLYIVGVFISFTMSQLGMVRHWGRELKLAKDPAVAAADDQVPHHQHDRLRHDRPGAGDRADHQVRAGRLDRAAGHVRAVPDHVEHPGAL